MPSTQAATREVRFEVATQRDGRWTIECARLGEIEARRIAQQLLATNAYEAVRVVRERDVAGRTLVETPVFAARRVGSGVPPLRVSATDERDSWCAELDDLYGARSRRTIGQLLRSFLDEFKTTPTELLHNIRFARKLDDAGTLLGTAVHRVARLRAEATTTPLATCVAELEALIATATRRMADAQADRRHPVPGEDGLDAFVARCRARSDDPSIVRFHIRHGVARDFEQRPTLLARIDAALSWLAGATDPDSFALIDELVADCLGAGALMQEALGVQRDLAAALLRAVELARGRAKPEPQQTAAWRAQLGRLLAEQACPETRTILLARVQRELASERPLTRGGTAEEANAVTAFAAALKDEGSGGYAGGAPMVEALVRRWKQIDRPGGFAEFELPSGDPVSRFGALVRMAPDCYGETRKRAVATLLIDAMREIPAVARPALQRFAPMIRAAGLLDPARDTLLGELGAVG
ncbi:MAG: hypothetical protein FJX57_17845 [Alphaproteobacteria bacterium]|nr:hypothetical protein [Alphaproteobacteria bacterium]